MDEQEPGSRIDTSPIYVPAPVRSRTWRSKLPDRIAKAILIAMFAVTGLVVLGSLVSCVILLLALPWRFPAELLGFGSLYLLAASPYLARAAAAPLGWRRHLVGERGNALTSRAWLRQRLDGLGLHGVEIVAPTDSRRRSVARYGEDKTILISSEHERARGAPAYAAAARGLACMILLKDRPALALLPRLVGAAQALHSAATGLLIGGVLVAVPELRRAALALLPAAAVLQLAGAAFELAVARQAAHQLRGDPQLGRDGAELAVHLVRRGTIAQLARTLAFVAVAVLAAPVVASLAGVAAPMAALPLGAAPPLTGTARWIAELAAASTAAGCVALAVWRRLPLLVLLAASALGLATACASPTLIALVWDQPFTTAHPWAVALAVAAAWPTALALGLAIPALLWRLAFLRVLREPELHEQPEGLEERNARLKARMSSPTRGPAPSWPLALLGGLWHLAIVSQPLPLAYFTLSALW